MSTSPFSNSTRLLRFCSTHALLHQRRCDLPFFCKGVVGGEVASPKVMWGQKASRERQSKRPLKREFFLNDVESKPLLWYTKNHSSPPHQRSSSHHLYHPYPHHLIPSPFLFPFPNEDGDGDDEEVGSKRVSQHAWETHSGDGKLFSLERQYDVLTCKITRSVCTIRPHRRCATDYSCVIHPFGLRMAGGRQLSINFLGCSCLTRRVEGVRFDGRIDRSSFFCWKTGAKTDLWSSTISHFFKWKISSFLSPPTIPSEKFPILRRNSDWEVFPMPISDSQVFIGLFAALLAGILAIRLGIELYA